MERLTKRCNGVVTYIGASNEYENGQIACEVRPQGVRELLERVAAYEDTRLTPEQCENAKTIIESAFSDDTSKAERIRELLKADKDGRLVVLPVKPVLTHTISSMLYIIEDGEIYEDSLYEAVVGMSENGEINVVYTTLSDQITFEQTDIGKTVFLAREKAEKALEAMENL